MGNRFLRVITSTFYNVIYKNFHAKNSLLGWIAPPSYKGLYLNIINGHVKKLDVDNRGNSNKVLLDGGSLYGKCNILIQGNNNIVIVKDECQLANLCITIRGNNCKVEIGASTSSNGTHIYCIGNGHLVKIGKDCMFAMGTELWSSDSHSILSFETGDIINNHKHDVIIGDHVWLAEYAKILKGVTVADNCVIGMCAVLTKNTIPNSIYVGIPAKLAKQGITWKR